MPESESPARACTREPDPTGASHEPGWATRTVSDLSSLLLELTRALRGLDFYGETDALRRPLVDHAHRAFESELSRAGAIDLHLTAEGFQLAGMEEAVPTSGPIAELAGALERHALHRIRIDPTLTRTALQGLLELLTQPTERFGSAERFATTLAARDITGIRLNDLDTAEESLPRPLGSTPPRASASLGSMLLGGPEAGPEESVLPGPGDDEKPTLDCHPLELPSSDDRGERLRARLTELDRLIDDDAYRRLAGDVVIWAKQLWSEGLANECYRALLIFADHAVGIGGRSERQARTAAACFADLACGERLGDLIDRATGRVPGSGVRAAQLLLELGEPAVPAIFEQICASGEESRAAPLCALVLMLGEASLPTLLAAIESSDETRAQLGIRLAGELQNPHALPTLQRAMRHPETERRMEAIRAISLLPGAEARQALELALASDLDEIVVAATEALAASGAHQAVPALLEVLEANLQQMRTQVSVRLIEALGRIGDERAAPQLTAILERRPMRHRSHWHTIQLTAVDALAGLPPASARRGLQRAAREAAGPVRVRAQRWLELLPSTV
ncbi:MAG: HEAT repeat domain-containing protein [Deltaproteobacteria bacterium]|jgi:hypothetical protein|nr:HEAT repeat domain-containing protein [Deltaproteobacteria bacterium]